MPALLLKMKITSEFRLPNRLFEIYASRLSDWCRNISVDNSLQRRTGHFTYYLTYLFNANVTSY